MIQPHTGVDHKKRSKLCNDVVRLNNRIHTKRITVLNSNHSWTVCDIMALLYAFVLKVKYANKYWVSENCPDKVVDIQAVRKSSTDQQFWWTFVFCGSVKKTSAVDYSNYSTSAAPRVWNRPPSLSHRVLRFSSGSWKLICSLPAISATEWLTHHLTVLFFSANPLIH